MFVLKPDLNKFPSFCLLVEATTFVERSLWIVFHQVGGLQNEQILVFQSFECFTKRAAYKMNKVCLFKFFKFQTFENLMILSKEVFESEVFFFQHLSQSIDYYCLLSINSFLRNGA